jgi:hypothetical protein
MDEEKPTKRRRLRREHEIEEKEKEKEKVNEIVSEKEKSGSEGEDEVESDNEDGILHRFSDVELPFSDSELSEGEDLMETMAQDYEVDPRLDQYDPTMMDETQYQVMDVNARRAAEEVLRRREKEMARLVWCFSL